MRERENNEISKNEVTKSHQLVLISLFINEAYVFFIFHYFPSHMQLVTFHLPFFLFSIIFISKMSINASCLSKALSIAFANFL